MNPILIVDDDETIRDTLKQIFEFSDYSVVTATNGKEAIDYLKDPQHQNERPCAVFLDLMMPVMDGWQFMEERARDPKISSVPVIILTAAPIDRTRSLVNDGVILKPFQLEQVLDMAEKFCQTA